MNAMKNKIQSQRGASITFALLLFLVCAVISGVVIVAATATSGRLNEIAESDQRYYAVTSATELLKNSLGFNSDDTPGKIVTVKTVETEEVTKKYVDGVETKGSPVVTKEVKMWYGNEEDSPIVLEDKKSLASLSILSDMAYRVAKGEYGSALIEDETLLPSLPRKLTLTASDVDKNIADMFTVELLEQKEPNVDLENGVFSILVSKKDNKDSTGKKAYTLKLSFKADIKTTQDVNTSRGTPKNVSNGGKSYEVDETTVTTTQTKMIWVLTGITKATMQA